MKYSEFEIIAKENGWVLYKHHGHWLYASKLGIAIAISKTTSRFLITTDNEYYGISEEKEFIEACYELAETPIEDREDEKYYVVELPFLNAADEKYYVVELPFLNAADKELFLHRYFDTPYWCTMYASYASRFTEKEIKEIDPRLWEFAVEVEDEI